MEKRSLPQPLLTESLEQSPTDHSCWNPSRRFKFLENEVGRYFKCYVTDKEDWVLVSIKFRCKGLFGSLEEQDGDSLIEAFEYCLELKFRSTSRPVNRATPIFLSISPGLE